MFKTKGGGGQRLFEQCSKKLRIWRSLAPLKLHTQSKHGGLVYVCSVCGHQANRKNSLKSHMAVKHYGERFRCDKCNYQSASKYSIKLHTQSMHDGLGFRYVCRECGYKTNRKIPFEGHMSFKHGGEQFKCDKCDYHATKQSLKLHTKSKHDRLRYPCGECGFKATQKHCLKSHIASKHGGAVELRLKDLTGQIFNDLLNEQENSSNPKPAKKFKEYCMKSKSKSEKYV